jgi:hypothetical protein
VRRRVPVRENEPSLFDLLLDESCPWEALDTKHQLQTIDVLARLIANAALAPEEEKDDE